MLKFFNELGVYFILLGKVFKKPDKTKVFWQQLVFEIDKIGLDSLGIVFIISIFMGGVVAIQTAFNIDSPWFPVYSVGFTVRQSVILEFSPTIVSLILAGKVGSHIASEIGTMRVTEQIDALDIMGVNSANYLILPKIVAAMIINPILVVISMFLGIFGGWLACYFTGLVMSAHYVYGVQLDFRGYDVFYALVKTIVFAFLITSASSYKGYYVEGGSLEVGKASTKAVVYSSILIILFNLILTQMLLS
ncbi:MAG: ABC transporter permease [Bacteroidales bacterium]|nr:ABC transporter permease [Bacteroidales bacterium]